MRKRLATAMLLLLLAAPAAQAADLMHESDLYVMNFAGADIPGYNFDQSGLYPSPHYNYLRVDEDGDGVWESNWNYTGHRVLNMINTTRLADGGEGAYASVPVYCLDAVTNAEGGHAYRCMNIEASSYFSAETAGRMRAVLKNAFPYEQDMAALTRRVNAWISASAPDVQPAAALTDTECITAVQTVLWKLANDVEIVSPYLGTDSRRFSRSSCVYPAYLDEPASAHTADNCAALVAYLLSLPPLAPEDPLITEAAFTRTVATLTRSAEGVWTASIEAEISLHASAGTSLTLLASAQDAVSQPQPVRNGQHVYTITLTGLTDPAAPITLTLSGVQTARDAFLFHPEGGRDASQTMGAYTELATPVMAAVTLRDPVVDDSVPTTGDDAHPLLLFLTGLLSAGAMLFLRMGW